MKRRRRILWKRVIAWLSLWALIIGGGYIYFRSGLLTITSYEIEGAPESYVEGLKNDMDILAGQKLYKMLPGNRVISFHHDDIRTLVLETLPNTRKVRIYPKSFHTLQVSIQPYTPLFSVSDTHAITEDSIVYKEIVPLTDYPRLHVGSTTEVTPETFISLSKLTKELSAVLFPIEHIDIDDYDDIRLYDKSKRSAIILRTSSDMDKIWSNVLSAIDTDPLKSKLTSKNETLEYLDTRFGNKVFYKFGNGAAPVIIENNDVITSTTTDIQ